MNLHHAARALGGEVVGGQILAPGPGHSKADRSLAVKPSRQSRDGFVVHSYAGDDWRACADHVRERLGIANDIRTGATRSRVVLRLPATSPLPQEPANTNGDLARDIFAQSTDPRGTLAETYLARERGLPGILDDTLALTLRFHRSCPFGRDRAPALVCAVRDARAVMGGCMALGDLDEVERVIFSDIGRIIAIQRIRLDAEGRKVERRTLGPLGADGCVFLSSIWQNFYEAQACIAEGIETGLAMRAFGYQGVVALCGAGRFRSFEPPFHWGEITISGENDGGASEAGWRAAGDRWAEEGRSVRVWFPPEDCKDANDALIGGRK